jgi:hypothetical protein
MFGCLSTPYSIKGLLDRKYTVYTQRRLYGSAFSHVFTVRSTLLHIDRPEPLEDGWLAIGEHRPASALKIAFSPCSEVHCTERQRVYCICGVVRTYSVECLQKRSSIRR